MSKKYVQYTISVSVSAEERLEDVVYDADSEEWNEESIQEYIMQEKWDFLSESAYPSDWDVEVRIIERDE